MKARDQKEMDELVRVKALRQIEINEMQVRPNGTDDLWYSKIPVRLDSNINNNCCFTH